MDEIVEMRIKFLEALLKQYFEITEKSGHKTKKRNENIDKMLEELHKLYKQRNK